MPAPGKSKQNPAARKSLKSNGKNGPKRLEKPAEQGEETASQTSAALPIELQQLILNIFKDSFPERIGSHLTELLQQIKKHLFNRDFDKAFGRDDYLEAYAVRWSASRAVGYLYPLYETIGALLRTKELGTREIVLAGGISSHPAQNNAPRRDIKIACLGGGAGAEIVSLGGVLNLLLRCDGQSLQSKEEQKEGEKTSTSLTSIHFDIKLIDVANWDRISRTLHGHITTPPALSKYASATVRALSVPLAPASNFTATFHQQDLLNLTSEKLAKLLGTPDLVTLFFTLNELYTTSISQTQLFLHTLTACVQTGTLFLIVDSAGSYSTVSLNGASKKYPMHWLIDHTLVPEPTSTREEGTAKWEKLKEEESRWSRIPEGLKYALELENMRFQLHLYRRLSGCA